MIVVMMMIMMMWIMVLKTDGTGASDGKKDEQV